MKYQPIRDGQAKIIQRLKDTNRTPAGVGGGFCVTNRNKPDTSSSWNLIPAIPLRAQYNLNKAEASTPAAASFNLFNNSCRNLTNVVFPSPLPLLWELRKNVANHALDV